MNRRSFLKGLLGGGAVVAAPTLFIPKVTRPIWRAEARCLVCGFQQSDHFGPMKGCNNLIKFSKPKYVGKFPQREDIRIKPYQPISALDEIMREEDARALAHIQWGTSSSGLILPTRSSRV